MFAAASLYERSTWIMSLILLGAGYLYAAPVIEALIYGVVIPEPGRSAVMFVVLVVVLSVISHILLAIADPDTADQPMDERDRLAAIRSGHRTAIVFGILVIKSLLAYLLVRSGDLLFHMIFLSMVVSQLLEYGLTILAYRRGV